MCAVLLVWPSLVTVRTVVVRCFSVVSVFGFGLAVPVLGFVLVMHVFVRRFGFRGGLIRRRLCFVLRGVGMLL
jgi:cytochrome c biogenesis protein CcdA